MALPPIYSDALVYASLTALMSIGLTLTFMTTKVPNFAHGNFISIGIYTAYLLDAYDKVTPYEAAIVALFLGGLAGLGIYALALRPLEKAGYTFIELAVATFAVGVIFTGIFGVMIDYLVTHGATDADFFIMSATDFTVFGTSGVVVVSPLLLSLVSILLYVVFTKTKFGVGLRAGVENASLASTLGVNVDRTRGFAWFISGGFAAAAGSIIVLWIPGGTTIGNSFLLTIFAASVLGGLSSIPGSIVGGVIVGGGPILLTQYLSQYVGAWITGYQVAIPLLIMTATLLLVPEGLPAVKWNWLLARFR